MKLPDMDQRLTDLQARSRKVFAAEYERLESFWAKQYERGEVATAQHIESTNDEG